MSPLKRRATSAVRTPQRPAPNPCQTIFRSSIRDRRTNHPLNRVSAFKVREVRGTIDRLLRTVVEVAAFVTGGSSAPVPFLLGCCTTEDKATWLKDLPGHIARELGYNLIPAIEALTVEGVAADDILTFILSIKPQVDQLLVDCDAIQTGIRAVFDHSGSYPHDVK